MPQNKTKIAAGLTDFFKNPITREMIKLANEEDIVD